MQDLPAQELLALYAGELWLDEGIDAEQARVPDGAGVLLYDKQMNGEVVDTRGHSAHSVPCRLCVMCWSCLPL